MARDYEKVLEAAELMNFRGYLDSEGLQKQKAAKSRFGVTVRNFVYALFREGPDHGALAFSVSADLHRIAATGKHSAAAVADTRAALLAEIGKRSRNGSLMRFLIRWGPPALGLAGIAVFAWFKLRVLG